MDYEDDEYDGYGDKKEKVYITVSHSIKLPYSNWVEKPEDDTAEQNQLAWDKTRELMNRLIEGSK
jgi:hypothetical protein